MNKILVIGNVGSDPEMRYTPNGTAVTSFSLATNRVYTNASGERKEETEWFTVNAWGREAENSNQYVTKGMKIYAEGRLKTDTWTGNDGQARFRLQINADRILFLDRSGEPSQPKPDESVQDAGSNNQSNTSESKPSDDIEDLPW
ncbi:MAG: single-stranded DNA-binding protein [SAR202 cluster bacterium]|nr:single-stranded DNA-binding protein [SAR202 cluster bacterium]|tara:strand:- start:3340 stop:3774 length:435 start_codon:yes stop_codon:yes gene_type:complete